MITIDYKILREGPFELSSEEEQWRLWVNGTEEEMSLPDEAWCYTFDDSRFEFAKDRGVLAEYFSEQFIDAMLELDKFGRKVPNDLGSMETQIEHPAMEAVRVAAQKALKLLDEQHPEK